MTTDNEPHPVRRVSRIAVTAAGLAIGSLASPAFAAPPADWQSPPDVGFLHYFWILVGIPLVAIAVISLLVDLPSMIRGRSSDGASAFQDNPEWFGGPRRGVEAADDKVPADGSKQGGASARW